MMARSGLILLPALLLAASACSSPPPPPPALPKPVAIAPHDQPPPKPHFVRRKPLHKPEEKLPATASKQEETTVADAAPHSAPQTGPSAGSPASAPAGAIPDAGE